MSNCWYGRGRQPSCTFWHVIVRVNSVHLVARGCSESEEPCSSVNQRASCVSPLTYPDVLDSPPSDSFLWRLLCFFLEPRLEDVTSSMSTVPLAMSAMLYTAPTTAQYCVSHGARGRGCAAHHVLDNRNVRILAVIIVTNDVRVRGTAATSSASAETWHHVSVLHVNPRVPGTALPITVLAAVLSLQLAEEGVIIIITRHVKEGASACAATGTATSVAHVT